MHIVVAGAVAAVVGVSDCEGFGRRFPEVWEGDGGESSVELIQEEICMNGGNGGEEGRGKELMAKNSRIGNFFTFTEKI
ncbi:hypothetical protein CCP2SC5_130003 [Azospirillaceae bacterium]